MRQLLAAIACAVTACCGCAEGRGPAEPPAPAAKQEQPTKERPIVLNTTARGGGLIFGGPDGHTRKSIEFGDAMIRCAISPNGKRAAILTYDWKRTQARWVTFFDESGEVLNNVMLPAPPPSRQWLLPNAAGIAISNTPEAVVTITRVQYYEGPVRPEIRLESSVERYHVSLAGVVQEVPGDADEQIWPVFPDSGGIVLLRTSGESYRPRPWLIERYDEGFRLRWRKEIEANWLGYLKGKHDFSVLRHREGVREFLHFREDGSFERETPEPATSGLSGRRASP